MTAATARTAPRGRSAGPKARVTARVKLLALPDRAIVAREDNANGARGKGGAGSVRVGAELMRLYAQYMHVEYSSLGSDYVFANLWGGQVGRSMTYATLARRNGVPIDVISQLITHRSVQTTQQTYTRLDVEDLRRELQRAGGLGMVEDLL